MSAIDGISSSTSSTISSATSSAESSGALKGTQDEFLKLFMAQLQYQDPFAPTSNAEMVGQLAQISGVEQAKQTNEQLSDLTAAQAAVANSNLSSLVGRDCSANVGSFSVDATGGTPPPIDISSANPTKGATLVVNDANGKKVAEIPIPDGTTKGSVQWDGKDSTGKPLPAGSYSMTIAQGTGTSAPTASWGGNVQSVELTPTGARLRIGGVLLSPGDIHTIGNSSPVIPAVGQ